MKMQSSSSVCYSVAKIESDLGGPSRMIGSGIGSPVPSNLQFGIRKQSERLSASALKVGKESHRIRKPPLPLPQVQYRPPIIIHTYSPKVIHTEPDDFMSLVQKLTGSSDTRLRLKRNLSAKKGAKSGDRTKVDTTDLEQQGMNLRPYSFVCFKDFSALQHLNVKLVENVASFRCFLKDLNGIWSRSGYFTISSLTMHRPATNSLQDQKMPAVDHRLQSPKSRPS